MTTYNIDLCFDNPADSKDEQSIIVPMRNDMNLPEEIEIKSVIIECPGGGNTSVDIVGDRDILNEWMKEYYCPDFDDDEIAETFEV